MSKHTPGPWRFDGYFIMSSVPGRAIHSVVDDVCISEADSYLIAAAPEMLEALEELVHVFSEANYEYDSFTFQHAKNAIKKARGET